MGHCRADRENFRKIFLLTLDNCIELPRTRFIITMQNDESMSAIGADLLSHAQEFGERIRLPLTTQLFPFLFLASRRMTTREMSEWLETNKGVKLSGPMISKGLQRPDLHLSRIAEHVQPLANYIAAVHSVDLKWLLFKEDPITGASALGSLWEKVIDHFDEPSEGVREALDTLMEMWDPIPQEVKFMCRKYFDFDDADNEESDDESSQSTPQESTP